MADDKKISIFDYYEKKKTDWWDGVVDEESAKEQHRKNIEKIRQVLQWRTDKDRPLSILVLHGSGRHPVMSCAHEMSNSQLLLSRGLSLARKEFSGEVEVDEFILRELFLEPCNNCVSTTSALCNFPCSCFPGDDISTRIYPAIIKADVILLSTGVNQSMISSRLKIVIDRLIAVDGGYFIEELPMKDSIWRAKMIQHSLDEPVYDQRMFGKVASYFVTSKDLKNTKETGVPTDKKWYKGYDELVIGSLYSNGIDYGWFHADPFYVIAGADPDVEYGYDKSEYNNEQLHEESKEVVLAALHLAERHRNEPPIFDGKGGRINRT